MFGIICKSENGLLLSSEMESQAWQAIEELLPLLGGENFASSLFLWKSKGFASPRETYAWRKAIDLIKESDLKEKSKHSRSQGETFSLMQSKPIMLRVAGEIASALIHSHDLGHAIEFSQISSTEPL